MPGDRSSLDSKHRHYERRSPRAARTKREPAGWRTILHAGGHRLPTGGKRRAQASAAGVTATRRACGNRARRGRRADHLQLDRDAQPREARSSGSSNRENRSRRPSRREPRRSSSSGASRSKHARSRATCIEGKTKKTGRILPLHRPLLQPCLRQIATLLIG